MKEFEVGDIHRTLLYGGIFAYPADKKNQVPHPGVACRCFSLHFAKGMRMQVIGSRSEGHIDVTFCKWWPSRIKCINFPDTCQWLSVTIMLCHWPFARMASCDCSMRAPPCLSSWSRLAERCARGHGTMMEDCTWWNEWSRWTYELPWDLSIIEHLQIQIKFCILYTKISSKFNCEASCL